MISYLCQMESRNKHIEAVGMQSKMRVFRVMEKTCFGYMCPSSERPMQEWYVCSGFYPQC